MARVLLLQVRKGVDDPVVQPFPAIHLRLVLAGLSLGVVHATVLSDMDGKAHRACGLGAGSALILVRPDGHVAFRAPADGTKASVSCCRRILGAKR